MFVLCACTGFTIESLYIHGDAWKSKKKNDRSIENDAVSDVPGYRGWCSNGSHRFLQGKFHQVHTEDP